MPTLLIAILTLGAVGLFLALPGGRADTRRVGWVVLAAAGAVLLALLLQLVPGADPRGLFAGFALVAVFAALRVITHRKPVYSALYFILLIFAVTGLLVLLEATFLSMALVIIYAGAILVTYVFVIMLAQQSRPAPYDVKSREPVWGCLAGFLLLILLARQIELFLVPAQRTPLPAPVAEAAGTIEAVGVPLLTEYVVAIQIIGLLLLAALVGAIAIARRRATPRVESEGDE
jgi:NADH-quinone oxidoreductase subunit J